MGSQNNVQFRVIGEASDNNVKVVDGPIPISLFELRLSFGRVVYGSKKYI